MRLSDEALATAFSMFDSIFVWSLVAVRSFDGFDEPDDSLDGRIDVLKSLWYCYGGKSSKRM